MRKQNFALDRFLYWTNTISNSSKYSIYPETILTICLCREQLVEIWNNGLIAVIFVVLIAKKFYFKRFFSIFLSQHSTLFSLFIVGSPATFSCTFYELSNKCHKLLCVRPKLAVSSTTCACGKEDIFASNLCLAKFVKTEHCIRDFGLISLKIRFPLCFM